MKETVRIIFLNINRCLLPTPFQPSWSAEPFEPRWERKQFWKFPPDVAARVGGVRQCDRNRVSATRTRSDDFSRARRRRSNVLDAAPPTRSSEERRASPGVRRKRRRWKIRPSRSPARPRPRRSSCRWANDRGIRPKVRPLTEAGNWSCDIL